MDWMGVVALKRGGIREFHRAAEFVALAARRNIQADPGFLHFADLVFELSNFGDAVIFLFAGHAIFESKRKHVDVHDRVAACWNEIRTPVSSELKLSLAIFRERAANVNRDSCALGAANFLA